MIELSKIGGVILAGGKASRMDYLDKALLPLHGKALIQHVIERARPQVNNLVISVNRNPHLYEELQLPLVPDVGNDYDGPLLGIYSAMLWLSNCHAGNDLKYLACFPADVPEFPTDVVVSLAGQLDKSTAKLAYCCHQKQIQPLFSLWDFDLLQLIGAAVRRGICGPRLLLDEIENVQIDIAANRSGSFLNINSIEDLRQAERLVLEK